MPQQVGSAPRFSYTNGVTTPTTPGQMANGQMPNHHGQFLNPPSVNSANARPVTVRSVKRRDKAKTEEKRINLAASGAAAHSNPGTPKVNVRKAENDSNAAVMV